MIEKKILIVDDEAPIRDMLEMAFNRAGYSVFLAGSGEEALEILRHEDIAVLIIDLGLETMSGFDLCEQIREDSPDAVIYALSGFAGLFEPQEILEAGFDDYFAKPFSVKQLYQAVSQAFEKLDQRAAEQFKTPKIIKRILIIDDDEQFCWRLGNILRMEGFDVIEAYDGEEGLKQQNEKPADLIITDVIMPKKNGLEVILDVREKYPYTKFIAVSVGDGYIPEVEFNIAEILGAKTLEKPVGREDILETIAMLNH